MLIVGPDPRWREDINARWATSLNTILQMSQQRKDREEREYELHLRMLASQPEAAAGEFGDQIVKRWGRKHPELVGLVSTMRNRAQIEAESDSALGAYHRSYAQRIGQRNSDTMKLREMPDAILPPGGMAGPPAPNFEKQRLASQIAMNADPGWDALAAMPENERTLAITAMINRKLDMPKAPDTIGLSDLGDDLQGLAAAGLMPGTPEFNKAALVNANLAVGVDVETRMAEARRKQEERARLDRENDERDQANRIAAQENQAKLQGGLIEKRAAARPLKAGKVDPEEKEAQKRLDAELKDALKTPKVARKEWEKRRTEAAAAGEPFTDPEPKSLTVYEVNQLADIAKEAVGSGMDQSMVPAMKERYVALLASKSPKEALATIRSEVEAKLAQVE